MYIQIRSETPADLQKIEALTTAAFLNAAHRGGNEQHIIAALRSAGQLSVSLVAEAQDGLIGHAAVSPVSVSDGTPGWFGLGPVSVVPHHQRRGVGSRLVRAALRMLRQRGAAGCVVLGEPAYYGRFGFRADPNLVLPDVAAEYFQAKSFNLSIPRGSVAYHAAFAARR
jgi:putative acetyltransferase